MRVQDSALGHRPTFAMPLTEELLAVAALHPNRVAIAAGGRQLTYAELVADSRRLMAATRATWSRQRHTPEPVPDTRGIPIVATSTTSAFEVARTFAGLAGYRAVTATIDPCWPLAHRAGVIVDSGAGIVISDAPDVALGLRFAGGPDMVLDLYELHRREATLEPAEPPTIRGGDEALKEARMPTTPPA